MGVSNPVTESAALVCIILLSFFRRAKSVDFRKFLLALSAFAVINIFPSEAFSPERVFNDEPRFWRPATINYFNRGMAEAIHSPMRSSGYGFFVPHVWVTLKRLCPASPAGSYHFVAHVLLFIGVYFILELRFGLISGVVVLFFHITNLYMDTAGKFLVNSLHGEGVTSLFFAVFCVELLNHKWNTSAFVKWLLSGVIFASKPFASVLYLLVPFLAKQSRPGGVFRALSAALIVPVLWSICSYKFSGRVSRHIPYIPRSFDPSVAVPIFSFWISPGHINVTVFYGVAFTLPFLSGAIDRTSIRIAGIIVANLVLIYLLYATLPSYVERLSPYRYIMEMYYLFLVLFGASVGFLEKRVRGLIR